MGKSISALDHLNFLTRCNWRYFIILFVIQNGKETSGDKKFVQYHDLKKFSEEINIKGIACSS